MYTCSTPSVHPLGAKGSAVAPIIINIMCFRMRVHTSTQLQMRSMLDGFGVSYTSVVLLSTYLSSVAVTFSIDLELEGGGGGALEAFQQHLVSDATASEGSGDVGGGLTSFAGYSVMEGGRGLAGVTVTGERVMYLPPPPHTLLLPTVDKRVSYVPPSPPPPPPQKKPKIYYILYCYPQ